MATNTGILGFAGPLLILLVPLTVAAQETPKVEVFGGYSYLRLNGESGTSLKSANLNGWNASFKWNFTPRISLVADFSGNYGQRGMTPFFYLIQDPTKIKTKTGDMRQHTFLFGPEMRLVNRGRIKVNTRALIGVAHTNTLVVPFQEPVQLPLGPNGEPVTITNTQFFGGNGFAASLGGSVDCRITDRWSYRIVQPEVLLIRSSGVEKTQPDLRVSTGIVYTFGGSAPTNSSGRRVSFGVVGGGGLTDAFGQESSQSVSLPNGGTEIWRSRWASTRKDYIIGPMVEFELVSHLALEIDALYRPLNFTDSIAQPGESFQSGVTLTVVTWEFPVLAKYRFSTRTLKPFVESGPSFRSSGNLNGTAPSVYGGTAGVGFEAPLGKLKIAPVLRFTHWAADGEFFQPHTKRNQAELLVGLSF